MVGFSLYASETKEPVFEGKVSDWNGYQRYTFEVDGRKVWATVPKKAKEGKPWLLRAQFPGYDIETDIMLLERGFHIAFIKCGNAFGSPAALRSWDAFYNVMTEKHEFSKKVCIKAVSRGGLYAYRWAAEGPERVACIYGAVAVCDFKSWPGHNSEKKKNQENWASLLEQYDLTHEEALAYEKNPIDVLEPIAEAEIPLLNLVILKDQTVPPKENTFVLAERYRKLGGDIEIIELEEGKRPLHHQYTSEDLEDHHKKIVDFIEESFSKATIGRMQ
jgi:hypothetical protein